MAKISFDQAQKELDLAISLKKETAGMSLAEAMDYVAEKMGWTDQQRRDYKQSAVAAKQAWLEARDGITCECGERAKWLCKKTLQAIGDKAYDIFHFQCSSCGRKTDRQWRAPTMDGKECNYTTTYAIKDGKLQPILEPQP